MQGDGAFVTANGGFGGVVIGEGADDGDREPVRVIEAHVESVGHFAVVGVVFENAAGSDRERGELQPENADKGREDVWEQIGARAAGVVQILPPTEETVHGEGPLGRVAEEGLPVQIGPGDGAAVGNVHALAPVAITEVTRLHMLGPPDDALTDEVGDDFPRAAGVALVTDLDDALEPLGLEIEFLAQGGLGPMAHRLFAIDVLARANGIERLRDVERSGVAMHTRSMLLSASSSWCDGIDFGAGLGGHFLRAKGIGIVHADDLQGFSALNETQDGVDVAAAAATHADEPDAKFAVGAKDLSARDKRRGAQSAHGSGGGGGIADEAAAGHGGPRKAMAGFHWSNDKQVGVVVAMLLARATARRLANNQHPLYPPFGTFSPSDGAKGCGPEC